MKYSDRQLIKRVESLPTFTEWRGAVDIWVRSKADSYNVFDDKVYSFECKGGNPSFEMVNTGTINAGAYGLMNFRRYNPLGCAVMCADIIVMDSHIFGYHKGQYEAYIQSWTVGFPYTRDSNRNKKAENYGKIYTNRIGFNCHRAGIFSYFINNWSVACAVRNQRRQYNEWMRYMDRRKTLSVSILNEF